MLPAEKVLELTSLQDRFVDKVKVLCPCRGPHCDSMFDREAFISNRVFQRYERWIKISLLAVCQNGAQQYAE